jgi:hypothetical protein
LLSVVTAQHGVEFLHELHHSIAASTISKTIQNVRCLAPSVSELLKIGSERLVTHKLPTHDYVGTIDALKPMASPYTVTADETFTFCFVRRPDMWPWTCCGNAALAERNRTRCGEPLSNAVEGVAIAAQ